MSAHPSIRRRPSVRPRRTQAERSAATRALLLEAAIASLASVGWANTTTTEVCRRAGVSQGALFKHFPTKTELLCRAAEPVPALGAALAGDEAGVAELQQDALQELRRDLLRLGEPLLRHRPARSRGELRHRAERVVDLR